MSRDLEDVVRRFRSIVRELETGEVDPELERERDLIRIRADAQRKAWFLTLRPWTSTTAPGVH